MTVIYLMMGGHQTPQNILYIICEDYYILECNTM